MRLANERFSELPRLYRSFSEKLNGSIFLLSKDWNDYYPDAKELRAKLYSALEETDLSSAINRLYIVFGCMQDSVYFSVDEYKIVISDTKIQLKAAKLPTRLGKGNILLGLQLTRSSYMDLPKALFGVSGAVTYNIEDAYELLSMLNIFAIATKYGLTIELGDLLGEAMLLFSKLHECNIKQEIIDELHKKFLMARDAVRDYSYTIGSFGVLRVGASAKSVWHQRFGGLPDKSKTVFVLSDPLSRSRSGIYGIFTQYDPKQKPSITCLNLVAFSVEKLNSKQLSELSYLVDKISLILYSYVSRYLLFEKRIMLSLPESGTLTLYVARR